LSDGFDLDRLDLPEIFLHQPAREGESNDNDGETRERERLT
jgi:hypothetical protein